MTDQERWKREKFEVAIWERSKEATVIERVDGYTYRGLGLDQRGGFNDPWTLTHLGSGTVVVRIKPTHPSTVFRFATRIALCGDWTWTGVDGWANLEPMLPMKVQGLCTEYGFLLATTPVPPAEQGREDAAREIGLKRW